MLEDAWNVVALSRLRDYNLFELHWYQVLNISQPRVTEFSFWYFTYFISSIESFQPKHCSDILGNTRLSSKHYIEFMFCV